MKENQLSRVLLLLLFLALNSLSHAAGAYLDGEPVSVSTVCPVTGSAAVAKEITHGHFAYPDSPYLRTGDMANTGQVSPAKALPPRMWSVLTSGESVDKPTFIAA